MSAHIYPSSSLRSAHSRFKPAHDLSLWACAWYPRTFSSTHTCACFRSASPRSVPVHFLRNMPVHVFTSWAPAPCRASPAKPSFFSRGNGTSSRRPCCTCPPAGTGACTSRTCSSVERWRCTKTVLELDAVREPRSTARLALAVMHALRCRRRTGRCC